MALTEAGNWGMEVEIFRGGKAMFKNKIDNWTQFCTALIIFWAILSLTQIFFGDVAILNRVLTERAVQAGYIVSFRGFCLLLILAAVFSMTALLRRGLIIAPLVWALNFLRFALPGPWPDMVKNILFVSPLFNLLVLILVPIFLSLFLWLSLDYLDPRLKGGKYLLPILWPSLAALVFSGNLFLWHWSEAWGGGQFPRFSLAYLLTGFALVLLTAWKDSRPALLAYYLGQLIPLSIAVILLGWYDGLNVFLATLLPFAPGASLGIWLELMLMITGPLLLALSASQYYAWRRKEELVDLI